MLTQVTPWYDFLLVAGFVVSLPATILGLFYLYVRAFDE